MGPSPAKTIPRIEVGRRYTRAEAALALRVSTWTIDRDVRAGLLKAERLRKRVLFSGEELLRRLSL